MEEDWIDPVTHHHRDDPVWEPTALRCHGCEALELHRDTIPDGQRGVFVTLTRAGTFPDPAED